MIGRGAFGEVRLVRTKASKLHEVQIFALKSMKKEMMVVKNQIGHVRAERDILAEVREGDARIDPPYPISSPRPPSPPPKPKPRPPRTTGGSPCCTTASRTR